MKSIRSRGLKAQMQKGFTLVELAIVLVIAGIILVGVMKGTDSINKAKVERAVADLKGLQGMVMEYQKRTGRLPGDCNNDGRISFAPEGGIYMAATNASGVLDSTEADRTLPNPAVATGGTNGGAVGNCTASTDPEASINVVWNDMRRNNVVDPQRLPAELAKNPSGSFYALGNMTGPGGNANVIVVYSIPVWMAEAIDASIDGAVSYTGTGAPVAATDAAANNGRVRRWDTNGGSVFTANTGYQNGYALTGESRDSLISISYQFDVNKLTN